jgi:succinoglycan biosynthesis protein ExoA
MATEKRPLLTVVMPCRNAQGFVGRALRSLFDEWSIKSCEFLVVDGGSTDRTRQEVEELIKRLRQEDLPGGPGRDLSMLPPSLKGGTGGDRRDPPPLKKEGTGGDFQNNEVLWFASSRGTWVREAREGDRYDWNPLVGGRRRPVIRLIDNPFHIDSRGLNAGILEARGAYIARADAGATYAPGYLRRCVELLEQKEAANAGGIEVPVAGKGSLGEAMALAIRHPLGGRPAKAGYSGYSERAESGTYRRKLFDEIGLFDPRSRGDEASEMNVRIVLGGRKIWVDGGLKVYREVPATFGELAGRHFRFGRGRARTAKKHGAFTSWRQFASPLLVAMMAFSLVRSLKAPVYLLFFAAYAASVLAAALAGPAPEGSGAPGFETRLVSAAALMTMHVAWGAGFLWGLAADW